MFININITIRLNTFSRIYIFDKYMSRAGYTISNEDLLLINILNGMYNDNLRQIDRMNTSINTLNADNSRIRNLLIRLLRNQRENNNARGPNNTTRGENNTTRGENNARVPNNVTRGTNNVGASIERTAPVNTTIPTSIFGSSNGTGTTSGLGRLFVNNAPYVIDSFQQYRIPSAGGGTGRTFFSETLKLWSYFPHGRIAHMVYDPLYLPCMSV